MTGDGPTYLGLRGTPLVYAVTFCSGIGFLLFGYDLGYMGSLSTSPEFLSIFGDAVTNNASLLAFLISSYEVGATIGAVFQFWSGDRLGRKPNNLIGTVITALGAVIQTSSYGLAQFLVGRLISGFGLGIMTTVIPVWLTECATPKNRGRMMAMQLSTLILGLIISNWLDYGMAYYPGSIQWRFPSAFQTVFCVITWVIMPFLPESPRYLLRVGKVAQGRRAMAALRGSTEDDPAVDAEIRDIQYALAVEAKEEGSWTDCFRDGGIHGAWRVWLAFSCNLTQQMSGVNVMSSLGAYVFQTSIGMSRHDALLVSGGLQVWYFLSSLIPWYTTSHVGRRKLFIIGSVGMGSCMLLSAIFEGIGGKGLGYASAVVLYLFQTFFTIGWQSNLWLYPPEILPLKLRLRGGAISQVSQWLFTFLVVEITPPMITNIGYKTYIVFAIINFVTVPYVYFFFPETQGMPLEAVDLYFEDDADGKRPSVFSIAQNSKKKAYREEVLAKMKAREREGSFATTATTATGWEKKELA